MKIKFAALLLTVSFLHALTSYAKVEPHLTPVQGAPITETTWIPVSSTEGASSTIEGAMAAYDKGDYAEALQVVMPLAQRENTEAQKLLGNMYYNGQGVPQDYTKGVEWFRKAADQGNVKAQDNLGVMYEKGQGVPQDYRKAAEWYRKAAEQGDAIAQFHLGNMYYNGQGVPQDYTKAVEWFRKAAEQGNVGAQNNLGVMYDHGQGVPQDYTKAVEWFRKADEQGNVGAQNNLHIVEEALKDDQSAKTECTTHCGQGDPKQIEHPTDANSPPDVNRSDDGHGLALGIATLVAMVIGMKIWLWDIERKKEHAMQALSEELRKNKQIQLDENAKHCREIIASVINEHIHELTTREQQLVVIEAYGLKNYKNWEKEKQRFIHQVIMPAIQKIYPPSGATLSFELKGKPATLSYLLDCMVNEYRETHPTLAGIDYSRGYSPVEYEQYCARLLAEAGWKTRTTIATGDQGGDIIATKDGVTAVIQCKKYSNAVGNKAVQEVYAAMSYYNANKAVVVSNAVYTSSAKQIAGKTGVLLLHHNDLPNL